MNKTVLETLIDVPIKMTLKPKNFGLTGEIVAVFDDCIEFRTKTQTSYIDFDQIASIKKV